MELMRREVESSEQSLRGFVASAAHELRTPLTSIQGFSEALLDGTASTDDERTAVGSCHLPGIHPSAAPGRRPSYTLAVRLA